MQDFIAFTIAGLAVGGIYAITASGLTLTYMTTGVFNFAHGAIGMIIAFCFWQLRFELGWPPLLAWAVCILILAPLVGLLLEWSIMRRLEGTPEVTRLVVTVALLLFLVALALTVWDPSTFRSARPLFAGHVVEVLSVRISYNDLAVLVIAALVAVGLWGLLFHTRVGVAMRATVDDPSLVRMTGGDPTRSAQTAWVVSVMLAGLAGVLIAPKLTLSPLPLTLLIVNAYAAAVIGRLRNLSLTFAGAIVLGLLTSYAVGYVDDLGTDYLQGLVGTVPVLVLFAALLVLRPSRLSGHEAKSARVASDLTWRGGLAMGAAAVIGSLMLSQVLSSGDLFSSTKVWGLAIVALSIIPLVGYGGKLSLCQMTFAGVGAIVVAHAGAGIGGMLLAAVIAGALGALVALPALRLSGIYMALSTAAIAVIFDRWFFAFPEFSVFGGKFDVFQGGSLSIDRFSLLGIDLSRSTAFFVFSAFVFALMVLVVVWVRRSQFGARLLAISDSERAPASLGINVRTHTLAVFTLSAAMAGVGGAVYGMAVQSTTPDSFALFAGLPILLFMVVGGLDSPGAAAICGLFLGAPLVTNLAPGLDQATALLVGGTAILVGRNPNGMNADARKHIGHIARQAPFALGGIGAIALAAWVLCVAGVIGLTPWLIITCIGTPVLIFAVETFLKSRSGTELPHDDLRLGLSDRVERLGLEVPFGPHDVAVLDRVLGLRSKGKSNA